MYRQSLALFVFAAMAWAAVTNEPEADPPDRVARLNYVQGEVSLRPGGSEDWGAALLNRPLTTGDTLWTESGARAELHDGTTAIRLDSRTNAMIVVLDDRLLQLRVEEGSVIIHVRQLEEKEEVRVETPNAMAALVRPGEYRIDYSPSQQQTRIVVRGGEAEVSGPGPAFSVRSGQQALASGLDRPSLETVPAPGRDGFDEFALSRDRREDRQQTSRQYVAPGVIGAEDLDEYGDWRVEATYGPVWVPRVSVADWAPYRHGRWVSIAPWGWTWIDDAPWGFAPFHYGRWVHVHWGWVWVPGPIRIRPVYAPALVVFIGGGRPGFQVHFWIGSGGVAWVPLGPREVYVPPYRASRRYVTNINVSQTVIANPERVHQIDMARQHYQNQRIEGAVTAVPRDVFERNRPVSRSAVRVSAHEAGQATIGGSAPPVAVPRRSQAGDDSGRRVARPPVPAARPRMEQPRPSAPPSRVEQRRDRQIQKERQREERIRSKPGERKRPDS